MRWPGAFVPFLAILAALPCTGQHALLSISVQDQTGGAITGALIQAYNSATGVMRAGTTGHAGQLDLPMLQPGSYNVTVVASGFRPFSQTGIELKVNQGVRWRITLQLGPVTEAVEVDGDLPSLDTISGSLSQVVEGRQIRQTPLNGRNPIELIRLAPGVNLLASSFLDTRNFNLSSASVGGGQGGANAILLDGASLTLAERNEYVAAPNVDAVEEFRVETNSFSAEFGLTSGGVISMVTRSGTSRLQASAWEYLRNDAFDANGWTNNLAALQRPPLRYNQFGASAGGPIVTPSGRSQPRSFFFVNWEDYRYRSMVSSLTRTPSSLERAGDFSGSFIRSADGTLQPVRIFDPMTTRPNPAGAGFIRDPLAAARLPFSRLDRSSLAALAYVPLPNRPAQDLGGTGNFASSPGTYVDNRQFTMRIDHNLRESFKLYFRLVRNDVSNSANPPVFGLDNPAEPMGSTQTRRSWNALAGIQHAFAPGLLSETRFSVSRQSLRSNTPGMDVDAPRLIGLPPIVPGYMFPALLITDVQSIGNNYWQMALRGWTVGEMTQTIYLVRGDWTLRTGGDFRTYLRNHYQPGPASGEFNFGRALTGDPQSPSGSGFGLATFLLGSVESGRISVGNARAENIRYCALFLQADWKPNRRLAVNLGMRWDGIGRPTERYNRYSNFDPFAANPSTGAPGILKFAGLDFGRSVTWADRNNFGPRFGVAYDLTGRGKTLLRGGYAIFYYHGAALELPGDTGFTAMSSYQPADGPMPVFQFHAGPAFVLSPPGAGAPLNFVAGTTASMVEPWSRNPYVQQWNFGVQQSFGAKWIAEAAYAGNHGVKQFGHGYDLNEINPSFLALGLALDERVSNPHFGAIPSTSPIGGPTISRAQSLRPNPAMQSIQVSNPRLGNSIYHSLQLRLERKFASGFSMLNSITAGKLIGDVGRNIVDFVTDGGSPQNSVACGQFAASNRRLCRAIEPQDVSRAFVTSFLYNPGFAKGWELAGIVTGRSGLPLVIRGAQNRAADRPNILKSARLPASERSSNRWFDTAAFAAPPLFSFGTTPRTLPDTRGPGLFSVDLSVSRRFRLGEAGDLRFRVDAFNLLNRTNLNLPDTNYLSSSFGRIMSAGPGRALQLSLRWSL